MMSAATTSAATTSAATTSAATTSAAVIPRGGGAVAILVAGIVVAVIVATVAIEVERTPALWAVIGFISTIALAVGVHALA